MYRNAVALRIIIFLSGALILVPDAGPIAEQPSSSLGSEPSIAAGPPEDPLFTQDIGAWTYTAEFADRFKRLKLKEPGPTGAYAVNFQVHQVEDLDRCVFNVFLDSQLSIDYPEGPIGFLSFAYPSSWFFLKLSPEDQRAVDVAYHAKYREPRAFLTHAAGEIALSFFQNRANLKRGLAVLTFTLPCDQVSELKNPLQIRIRATAAQFHEIALPEHFLGWMQTTLEKWRRPEAGLDATNLPDRNVWSYSPQFGKRFGLPPLDEPGPVGAEAVAWRVVQYNREERSCFLDVYLDETVPIVLPEGNHGFSGSQPQLGYFLISKDKNDRIPWYDSYSVYGNTELYILREVSEKQIRKVPRNDRIGENLSRIVDRSPFSFDQYRKHAFPGLSYVVFNIGCMEPPAGKLGSVGFAVVKADGSKHQVALSVPFTEHMFQDWRVRHDLPRKCKHPKFSRHEKCDNHAN